MKTSKKRYKKLLRLAAEHRLTQPQANALKRINAIRKKKFEAARRSAMVAVTAAMGVCQMAHVQSRPIPAHGQPDRIEHIRAKAIRMAEIAIDTAQAIAQIFSR